MSSTIHNGRCFLRKRVMLDQEISIKKKNLFTCIIKSMEHSRMTQLPNKNERDRTDYFRWNIHK